MGKKPFHEWEEKHGLINNRSVEGFQYWNYMRRDMNMSFKDEYADLDPVFFKNMKEASKSGRINDLKRILKVFTPDGSDPVKKADVLILCHGRRQEIDGKLVSIYTDYLEDYFPDSVSVQRTGGGKGYRDSLKTRHIVFLEKLTTKSYIYKYLNRLIHPGEYNRIRRTVLDDMREAFADLKKNYSLNVNEEDFAGRAASLFFYYRYKKPRLEKLIKKISPKVIVEVVGRSFDAEIINEIAFENGIETVELQHGSVGFWYPDGVTLPQVPKWYYLFGNYWKKAVKLPVPEDHVLSMGFPYHDMMMEKYPGERRHRDDNTIIFLSSRKYGKELSAVAMELKELRPDIHIIYKLHPREYQDYSGVYAPLDSAGIEVIKDDSLPLYGLFSRSGMQVGVESTAVYEGMGFALRTFIWDIPMAASLKELASLGYASVFKDAGELSELIKAGDNDNTRYDIDDFWKRNSLNNIVSGIKGLL